MKSFFKSVMALILGIGSCASSKAQQTLVDIEMLTVNENVTTVITASEPIRFVDISTDRMAGDQPINNTLRIKPKKAAEDGELMGIVTIITERYRTQYGLVYTKQLQEAVSDKEISTEEMQSYHNPAVSMSTSDMYAYAQQIWMSSARFRDVSYRRHKMEIRLNNLYSIGDYFFIDFSVENRSNIHFDIDELRVKLQDKKVARATNSQIIEIKPVLSLVKTTRFKKSYRNVLVVRKMTFPDDKVLTIELSEQQISGRTVRLDIDYEEILTADTFDEKLLQIQ